MSYNPLKKKAQFSKNYIDNYKKKKSYFFLLAYFCHKKGAAVIGPLIFLGNHSQYAIYRTIGKNRGRQRGDCPPEQTFRGMQAGLCFSIPPSKRKKSPSQHVPNLMYAYADINLKKKQEIFPFFATPLEVEHCYIPGRQKLKKSFFVQVTINAPNFFRG